MPDSELDRVLRFYESRGRVEEISGDVGETARAWLEDAREDVQGMMLLLQARSYRLAYRAGYDVFQNAAEAVITYIGVRVASSEGHHEAVSAIANAVDRGVSGAFHASRADPARQTRRNSEYISTEPAAEVTEADARGIVQWAEDVLSAVDAIVSAPPPETIFTRARDTTES